MAKISFDIKNRWDGRVVYTAEIECETASSDAIKLGLAIRQAIKSGADLSGADLSGADLSGAYLSGADLSRADLSGANLSRAYLSGADLSRADLSRAYLGRANLGGANLGGANLSGANLGGANLSGANLSGQWVIQGATRSDGYPFFLQMLTGDAEPMVKAGCRLFTVAQAEAHWRATRGGTQLGDETGIIIMSLVALAKARGLWPVKKAEAA